MNAALTLLQEFGQEGLLTGIIVFLRVGAAMAVLPAFGERIIPQRVRIGLALAFTAIVTPAVAHYVEPLIKDQSVLTIMLATETFAGLTIGIGFRLFIHALQMGGLIALS